MDKKQLTTDSYNNNAIAYAARFDKLGVRTNDIEKTFSFFNKKNPKVLEIGCANGRDAKEILRYTDDYLGIDISPNLIEIARKNLPEARFEVADVENFEFPKNLDVVFAFASLIHSDKENLEKILNRIWESLNVGGVVYLSMKRGEYHHETIESEFGVRTYYFYTDEDILKMIRGKIKILFNEIIDYQNQKWVEMIIQKI